MNTLKPRSQAQVERQRPEHRAKGRYSKTNPCECCGKSAGVDDYSHSRIDTDPFHDLGLVLCAKCSAKVDDIADPHEAVAFLRAHGALGSGLRKAP
jgi:hypothetical protein